MLVQWTKDACWNPCWELPHTCILGSGAGAQWHTRAPEQALPALSAAPFPQAATSAGEKGGVYAFFIFVASLVSDCFLFWDSSG